MDDEASSTSPREKSTIAEKDKKEEDSGMQTKIDTTVRQIPLHELRAGQRGVVVRVGGKGPARRRMMETYSAARLMGVVTGGAALSFILSWAATAGQEPRDVLLARTSHRRPERPAGAALFRLHSPDCGRHAGPGRDPGSVWRGDKRQRAGLSPRAGQSPTRGAPCAQAGRSFCRGHDVSSQ